MKLIKIFIPIGEKIESVDEHIGKWHIHNPNFKYVTSEELIQLWKEQRINTLYFK